VETAERYQSFRVKLFSRTTMQAGAVRGFPLRERAAEIIMPAAKKFDDYSQFLPEY